jgi:hypothetical protein
LLGTAPTLNPSPPSLPSKGNPVLLIYTPEGGERREFSFKPLELMSVDIEAIEDVGGETWGNFGQFCEALGNWKMRAKRAALWVNLRHEQPRLRFPELVVRADELVLEWDDDEIAKFQAAAAESEDSDEKVELLALLADLGKASSSTTSEERSDAVGSTSPDSGSEA